MSPDKIQKLDELREKIGIIENIDTAIFSKANDVENDFSDAFIQEILSLYSCYTQAIKQHFQSQIAAL